jgi:hypothetical protein
VSAGCLSLLSANCVTDLFGVQHQDFHVVFLPDCWRNCAWADARWMARRIGGLRRADLERVFAESGWPSFSQQLGVEKLLARRNDLVQTFGLTGEGIPLEPCDPKLTIRVATLDGTDRQRFKASEGAQGFGLLIDDPLQFVAPGLVRPGDSWGDPTHPVPPLS